MENVAYFSFWEEIACSWIAFTNIPETQLNKYNYTWTLDRKVRKPTKLRRKRNLVRRFFFSGDKGYVKMQIDGKIQQSEFKYYAWQRVSGALMEIKIGRLDKYLLSAQLPTLISNFIKSYIRRRRIVRIIRVPVCSPLSGNFRSLPRFYLWDVGMSRAIYDPFSTIHQTNQYRTKQLWRVSETS